MRGAAGAVALVAGVLALVVLPAPSGEFATLLLASVAWWAGTRRLESRAARAAAVVGRLLASVGAAVALLLLLFRVLAALDVAE